MFNAFVVVLREFAELLVIAEALRAYLRHDGQLHQLRFVHAGIAAGAIAGFALSLWLLGASGLPWTRGMASIGVGAMGLLLATGVLSSVKALQSRVRESIEVWAERVTVKVAVAGIAAFAAGREALEISLFLQANSPSAGWPSTFAGAALGVAMLAGLGMLFRLITQRVNLMLMFQLSTLVLALFSIQLLVQGIGEALDVVTPQDMHGRVMDAAMPFLPGGARYAAVCVTLMLLPAAALAKRWWSESASARN